MASVKCTGSSNCSSLRHSSDSSSSSSSSSTSIPYFTAAMDTDQMVKVEIEAAEALADLAYLAMRENGGQLSSEKWGTKGKRARKGVKSESPTCDTEDNNVPVDSLSRRSELDHRVQDRVELSQQHSENGCRDQLVKPLNPNSELTRKIVKADKDVESLEPIPTCETNYTLFGCRRSRRNLNEAEKEERRIRRILANRESARQTIRRRQALCEELTRKAADLTWENENLKREKESALKEYRSLETTNKQLKEQMARAVKPKAEEISGNDRSSHVQMSRLSTNYPLFVCSPPTFTPYFWPSMVQSSSPYQSQPELQNVVVIPSNIHLPPSNSVSVGDSSHERENFMTINCPRTPYCVLPYSWFLPHHDHNSQLNPSFSLENKRDEICLDSQSSGHSSKVVEHSAEEVKEDQNSNTGLNSGSYSQSSVGVVIEGLDNHERGRVRNEDGYTPSTRAFHNSRGFTEKRSESDILHIKKVRDTVAAAEARKRRKQLTKLKNLHSRQLRMHY